jgi:hypothetical protein
MFEDEVTATGFILFFSDQKGYFISSREILAAPVSPLFHDEAQLWIKDDADVFLSRRSSIQSLLRRKIDGVKAILLSKKLIQQTQKATIQGRIPSMSGIGRKLRIEEEELSVSRALIVARMQRSL